VGAADGAADEDAEASGRARAFEGMPQGENGPSTMSRGPQQPTRGGLAQRGRGKVWVMDGRVYNYSKPGAVEAADSAEAQAMLAQQAQQAVAIHGLGPGGNRATFQHQQPQREGWERDEGGADQEGGGRGGPFRAGTSADDVGRGVGGRGRSSGSGGGRGGYKHKDQNKAAVANHRRKDRALAKASRGGFG
jgi:activating signal cointegrator complex subunit 2